MIYRIYDLALSSNIPLPELPPSSRVTADLEFRLVARPVPRGARRMWRRHWWNPGRAPWLSVSGAGGRFELRFSRLAHFVVAPASGTMTAHPGRGVPRATVRHLLLDQVVPLVISQRERVVLHASAVLTAGGVVAFLGPAGAGKSTLAASFASAGVPMLADDGLLVEQRGGVFATPGYPGVRLGPESVEAMGLGNAPTRRMAHYSEKSRYPALGPHSGRMRRRALVAIYMLDRTRATRSGEVLIEPLSRRDGLMELVKQTYLLDVHDRRLLKHQFGQLGQLADTVPVKRLRFRRQFKGLPQVRAAVLRDLSG